MIKVVFTYRTKKKDLPKLMEKFAESGRNQNFILKLPIKKLRHFSVLKAMRPLLF